RRRHALQQDGAGAPQGLRSDAGAALRHLHGLLRQWRRLLPLFLFRRARLRPDRAGRHLCAGLPADGRGAALRRAAAPEEDPAHGDDRALAMASYSPEMRGLGDIAARVTDVLGARILDRAIAFGELAVQVPAEAIVEVMTLLRD